MSFDKNSFRSFYTIYSVKIVRRKDLETRTDSPICAHVLFKSMEYIFVLFPFWKLIYLKFRSKPKQVKTTQYAIKIRNFSGQINLRCMKNVTVTLLLFNIYVIYQISGNRPPDRSWITDIFWYEIKKCPATSLIKNVDILPLEIWVVIYHENI